MNVHRSIGPASAGRVLCRVGSCDPTDRRHLWRLGTQLLAGMVKAGPVGRCRRSDAPGSADRLNSGLGPDRPGERNGAGEVREMR